MTLVIIVALAWLAWKPLRVLLLGGKPTYANGPAGEWVGQLDITGGYDPNSMGATPGPHKHAVLKFTLGIDDHFMDEYGGPGELWIVGEPEPRQVKIARFNVQAKDNNSLRFEMLAHPILVYFIRGQYTSEKLVVEQDDLNYLQLKGTLERGSDSDYTRLHQQLVSSASPSH